ncbi:unnamed protein product [Rhizophagus irregularis]|nr:unnamed protein product [Rhizophagus irregularis]
MEDDKSNKKKSKYIGDMASFASQGIQVASTGLGVAGDIAPLLSFSIDVKITGQVKSISNELEQFKIDQDDLAKYLQDMVAGVSTDVKGIGKDVKELLRLFIVILGLRIY